MSNNKRAITFTPDNTGDLVTEVIRAYLHGGNPSVMVKRVMEGVVKFITEKELAIQGASAGNRMDPAESHILNQLYSKLEQVHSEFKNLENFHYSM